MITTLIVLLILAALLLIVVILIQDPKGGGLSSEFGGSQSSHMFGVQKTDDIVEKLTWGFFTFILVGSIATLVLFKSGVSSQSTTNDVNVEKATSTTTLPSLPSTTTPAPATGEQPVATQSAEDK